jgi:hypothetical protein
MQHDGYRVMISHRFELDCVICRRLEKEIVQILHKSGLERGYCEDMIGKGHVEERIHP